MSLTINPIVLLRTGLPKSRKRSHSALSGPGEQKRGADEVAASSAHAQSSSPSKGRAVEDAHTLRKRHRIYVKGDGVPPPLQGLYRDQTELPAQLRQNISDCNFDEPSPIQQQAIPVLLARRDLLGIAPTGSGKTLAFLVPLIVQHLSNSEMRDHGVTSLILSPTRELAAQTARWVGRLSRHLKLSTMLLTKGTALAADFAKVDLLLATPLKLVRLLEKGRVQLTGVRYLVCDEVDKLLSDTSMVKQVDTIITACDHPHRVTAFFSATVGETVEELVRSVAASLIRVTVGDRNSVASSVKQELVFVSRGSGKLLAMRQLLATGGLIPPVLVFVSSNKQATQLHQYLLQGSAQVDVISADQGHAARTAAVENFRAGKTHVLLATDLLARGIDFVDVATVVNFDFPPTSLDYVHRVGRTGRAGRAGHAITFFTEEDRRMLRPIANLIHGSSSEVPTWMRHLHHRPNIRVKLKKVPAPLR